MTSPEYQAPTWVNEDDPAFIEGVSPDLGAGYLNELSGAVADHGQRLGAITPIVTNLQNTALDQATGDNRYILQTVAGTFAQADATTTALAGKQPLDADLTALAGLDSTTAGTVASDGAGWVKKTYAQLKTALGLVKGDVGLGNVDNTSDSAKPVSTATQTALDAKVGTADSRLTDTRTPTDNSVTDAKVTTGAAISADKLADGTTNKVLTAAERTKLAGVATSATANSTDAQLRDRATHTGTQSADTIIDGTTNHAFTAADDTKLGGIAAGATANSTDATLLARANHTGTQAVSTVTGLQTTLDAKAPLASPAFTGTPTGITKTHVGLGNVDNTSDAGKPVSTATQTALDGKAVADPPLQSGNYYIPVSAGSATTSSSLGISTLRVAAWVLDRPVTLSRLAADIPTAGEAGSKFRIGIWADDGTGWPGNLVVDAGQVNGDSATVQELTINATLPAGVYWLGGAVQAVTTTQPAVRIVSTVIAPQILIRQGTTLLASNTGTVGVSVGGVTGAFGSSFPGGGGPTGFAPRLIVKTA